MTNICFGKKNEERIAESPDKSVLHIIYLWFELTLYYSEAWKYYLHL